MAEDLEYCHPICHCLAMLPIVTIHSTETLTKTGITVSDLEFSSVAIHSVSEKHTSIINLAIHGFNNIPENYQYLFKVKPWTAVPYN